MKYSSLALLCLVHLTACGGSPFTGAELFADGGGELDTGIRPTNPNRDAGDAKDAAAAEAASPDAGDPPPQHDAGGEPEASPTPPVDAGSDGCTSWPSGGLEWTCGAYAGAPWETPVQSPSQFCWAMPHLDGIAYNTVATPMVCAGACMEDLSCECLTRSGIALCPSTRTFVGCMQLAPGEVVVQCQ